LQHFIYLVYIICFL